MDPAATQATSGYTITKTPNADGTTTISLSSTNPEYKNQSYTLQPGQQLYFVEKFLGDDSNNQEGNIGDDTALIVDSQGYIVQLPGGVSATNAPRNGTGRFQGNMTAAQRQQFMQQRIDACNGMSENDSCSIPSPRGQMNGTCQSQNSTLQCMVQRPPRTVGYSQ